jgi:predicted nucleic acid-binding protein
MRQKRHPMSVTDSQIAAAALVHGLPLVTRNGADLAPAGVRLFNPWK